MEQIPTRLQHLWEETEEVLGLKSDWDKERERLLRQTEVERPLVVSKCEGLHQFLAEQERLLLARLGELGEEIGRRREDNATHLGEEISRLSALITELEGKRQQPVLELLQCWDEKAMSPHLVPESPELEKRIRDFPRENDLQEAVTGFLEMNSAVTLKPVIMQGTAFSRMEWKSINCMNKLVQIQTDIIFLSKCKQMDIVPKGLKVKNPLQSTYHTDYADSLCPTLSKKLRNHLINILYSKQGKIKNELSKMDTLIKKQPSTQTSSWLDFTKTRQAIYSAHFASLQKKKDTKLSKLLHATRGHSNGSLNPPSNIVNLSNYTLSPAEAAVLSRGLSFCPSTPTNMIQFGGDLESYFRHLRLKEYFQNTSEQHTNPQRSPYQHYRKRDSRWTPPESRNSRLDFHIECFRRRARAEIVEKQHHLPHNLSHAEHNAIHSLRNNSDIIIKKADKGGAVVIMNRSEYEQEAARQLSNTSFYKPLPYDATESYQKQLQHLLKKLPEKAQDQIRTDTPLEPRPGIFYLLPKIHKPGNPGRPIISGIGTLTAGLSGYVDSLLRPYATSTPSYLRDTTDFLRKLQSIGDLPENTILATMDVEALYTNIPHKDGPEAVRNSIPDNVTANLVAELCDFVLNHNYFTFGDNVYLQISGTAMGTRMAPQYANIFMPDLEQRFLSSRPLKPLLYLCYIDDIFIIWTHGKEALEEFHHDFNNFHPTINLSLVQSTQEIHFLDTTVLINNGHINTTLYRKPTDRCPTCMPPAFTLTTPHDPSSTAKLCDTTAFAPTPQTETNTYKISVKFSYNYNTHLRK
ncbi:unnamed protein product [Lepidochelys kempii]